MTIRSKVQAALAAGVAVLALATAAAAQVNMSGISGGGPSHGGSDEAVGNSSPELPSIASRVYDPQVEYQKGAAALKAGKFRDAQAYFENSVEADPNNANTLFMLGVSKAAHNDFKGAVRAYEKSLQLDPVKLDVRREYAVALAKSGQADKAQAQLAKIKARSDACDGRCADADDLKAAVAAVQAALPAGGPG